MIETCQSAILWACVAVLSVLAAICSYNASARLWAVLRGRLRGWGITAFAAIACVCTIYARKGSVYYPRTDPTVSYLIDRGSYVTNDLVHIDFLRVIVPDTATLYIDRRQVDSADDEDWVTHETMTFAECSPPLDIPYADATNYDWAVYTDWTPGPSVVTNGVWHAFWGKDNRQRMFFIPVRTAVRVDGDTIATPKSKEDSSNDNP